MSWYRCFETTERVEGVIAGLVSSPCLNMAWNMAGWHGHWRLRRGFDLVFIHPYFGSNHTKKATHCIILIAIGLSDQALSFIM